VNGKYEGSGIYYFADKGREYKGEFLNNKMHGMGEETWADNRKYKGNYRNSKKDGEGTFIWTDGNMYQGNWRNDKQDGSGWYINVKEGTQREGVWAKGKRTEWTSEVMPIDSDSRV